MTAETGQTYDADLVDGAKVPGHIRDRLRYHQSQGHTAVRIVDNAERGYLLESYRDRLGDPVGARYEVAAAEHRDER